MICIAALWRARWHQWFYEFLVLSSGEVIFSYMALTHVRLKSLCLSGEAAGASFQVQGCLSINLRRIPERFRWQRTLEAAKGLNNWSTGTIPRVPVRSCRPCAAGPGYINCSRGLGDTAVAA